MADVFADYVSSMSGKKACRNYWAQVPTTISPDHPLPITEMDDMDGMDYIDLMDDRAKITSRYLSI